MQQLLLYTDSNTKFKIVTSFRPTAGQSARFIGSDCKAVFA